MANASFVEKQRNKCPICAIAKNVKNIHWTTFALNARKKPYLKIPQDFHRKIIMGAIEEN
jgi:hypothetical protein